MNENTCSELVNQGFPYSSPNDDYFFIPDYGTPNALFATNRNGNTAKIEIVKVEKEQKKVEMLFEWACEHLAEVDAETEKLQKQPKKETSRQTTKPQAKELPLASKHLTFQTPLIQ